MIRPRILYLSGALFFLAATRATAQQAAILRFPEDGVIAVVQDHVNGVALMLGHDSSSLAGWKAHFDPGMALDWLGAARAVVEYNQPQDAPYIMSPTLPTLGSGVIALIRRRLGEGWNETEIIYQAHPDSAAMTTTIGQTTAGLLLGLLTLHASGSAWVPPDPQDRDRVLPEGYAFDTPVRRLRRPEPVYPRSMSNDGRAGTAWISGVVGTDGKIHDSSIVILYATAPAFGAAARAALAAAEFEPAKLLGRPVPVRVFEVVTYGGQSGPSGRSGQ